jgi:NADPH:quinone reductase-like Zn-dependent oxidoreductase
MTLSIAMTAAGGVDVLTVRCDLPPPASHQVRLRQTPIGVNFVDIYQRMGLYRRRLMSSADALVTARIVLPRARDHLVL